MRCWTGIPTGELSRPGEEGNIIDTLGAALHAAHHLRWLVPVSRWSVLLGVVGLALCLLVWRPLADRLGWRRGPTLLATLSLMAALVLTLAPKSWTGNHRSLAQCLPDDPSGWLDAAGRVGHGLESLLNVAMLMPLGFALVLATRRFLGPAVLMVALPAVIELTQIAVPGRECSPADWYANALGGLLGVAIGVLGNRLLAARDETRDPGRHDPDRTGTGRPSSASRAGLSGRP